MNCFLETAAAVWIGIIHTVSSKALETDLVTAAKEQLRDTIQTMQEQIGKHNSELVTITSTVREQRKTLSKERMKTLLLKSKRTRASMATIHSKLTLMESQLDALENNDVNKTILSTLQTSAKAMKKMGLASDLRKTDEVISELEQSMEHAHDINSTVNSGITQMDMGVDDDSLEEELNILLGIDDDHNNTTVASVSSLPRVVVVAPPTTTNFTIDDNSTVKQDNDNNDNNSAGAMERSGGKMTFKRQPITTAIPEEIGEADEDERLLVAA